MRKALNLQSEYIEKVDSKHYTIDSMNGLKKVFKDYNSLSTLVVFMGSQDKNNLNVLNVISEFNFECAAMTLGGAPGLFESKYIKNEPTFIWKTKKFIKDILYFFKKYQYPVANYWILGGGEGKSLFRHYVRSNQKSKDIWAHNYDYENYRKIKIEDVRKDDHIVFIDQNPYAHPDFQRFGVDVPITKSKYTKMIAKLFAKLEAQTGKKVIIAAHPTSEINSLTLLYDQRHVLKGNTAELIRDSYAVILHSSISIQYVILFNKPLVLYTTDELDKSYLYKFSQEYSDALDLDVINIDHGDLSQLELKPLQKDKRNQWMENYIKISTSPEKPLWDIFVDNIENHADD